jgi:hypothetical protein
MKNEKQIEQHKKLEHEEHQRPTGARKTFTLRCLNLGIYRLAPPI